MNTQITAAITPYLGKPFRLPKNDELETVQFIDFPNLSDDDRTDLFDHFLEGELETLVDQGHMVPIAVLGLTDNPDSFAEMNHGGLLLWDLRPGTSQKEIHYYNNNTDEFSLAAKDLATLKVQPLETKKLTVAEQDAAQLQSPEFAPDWEKVGELYRGAEYQEALDLCEALAERIVTSNDELTRMKVILLIELSRTEEALALADNLVIDAMEDGPSQEFCGRMKLRAQAYDRALTQAESLLDWLGDDDNPKLRAAALATRGLAKIHLGHKESGVEDLKEAKKLHTTVTLKYPEVRQHLS